MTTMTEAEIIAAYDRPDIAPALSRLIALARIGAKVVAADEARIDYVKFAKKPQTTFVKFDKEALDRLQRDLVALASVGE